jgi:hypothetical protein
MQIAEDKALEILTELIRKPESKAEDIPRIWGEILTAYNSTFSPPVEEPKKKRRKRRIQGPMSPNLGWPQGVSRAEYKMWKENQQAKGVTDGLNPQEYKRLKDVGQAKAEAAATVKKAPAVEEKAPKKAKK